MSFVEDRIKSAIKDSIDNLRRQMAMIPENMQRDPWYKWAQIEEMRLVGILMARGYNPIDCSRCSAKFLPHEIPTYGPLPPPDLCADCQPEWSPYKTNH